MGAPGLSVRRPLLRSGRGEGNGAGTKRQKTAAVQDAGATVGRATRNRQAMECASLVELSHGCAGVECPASLIEERARRGQRGGDKAAEDCRSPRRWRDGRAGHEKPTGYGVRQSRGAFAWVRRG